MTIPEHIKHDEKLSAVWSAMDEIAPLALADSSWDNVGVLLQAPSPKQNKGKKVMLAIDLTEDVADEVLSDGEVAVLIVYHPIIFRALKSITLQNSQQRSLLRLANANISIYAPHTSLDACRGGVNDWLIEICIGSDESPTMALQSSKPIPQGYEGSGFGRSIELKQGSISLRELLDRIKAGTKLDHLQVACPDRFKDWDTPSINSIAVCAGSGSSVLNGTKADVYLTGEMSHHEVLACVAQGIIVILTNHSNSERGYLDKVLKGRLQTIFQQRESDLQVCLSLRDRDPLVTV